MTRSATVALCLGAMLITAACTNKTGVADGVSQRAATLSDASVELTIEESRQRMTLPADGEDLTLVIEDLDNGSINRTPMTSGLAVGMLADRRVSAFWPIIDEWGGPGLNRQRERGIEALPIGDLEAYSGDVLGGPDEMREVLRKVYALRTLGRFDDAHSIIDMAIGSRRFADPDVHEIIIVAKSDLYKTAGRRFEAIALLTEYVSEAVPNRTGQALSNLSELQVEEGLFTAGMETLDKLDLLLGYGPGEGEPLATNWMRACALVGLSNDPVRKRKIVDEMRSAWNEVVLQDREPTAGLDKGHVVPSYFRFALCTGDGTALADYLVHDAREGRVPSAASWLFQPLYKPIDADHGKAIAQATRDPRLTDTVISVRALDDSYFAAVNGWRLSNVE